MATNFFHPSLLLLFWDPGSEIRDPGWVKIRIRDKHPGIRDKHSGPATLFTGRNVKSSSNTKHRTARLQHIYRYKEKSPKKELADMAFLMPYY